MTTVLWLIAAVLVVSGILAIIRKQVMWGIVLIVVGLLVRVRASVEPGASSTDHDGEGGELEPSMSADLGPGDSFAGIDVEVVTTQQRGERVLGSGPVASHTVAGGEQDLQRGAGVAGAPVGESFAVPG